MCNPTRFLILCTVLAAVPLFSQWPTSPDSALQVGVGDETYILSDGEGGAFVLWDGDGWMHMQKLNKHGYIQWQNNGIDLGGNPADSCIQEVNTEFPMVLDGEGGVYVLFSDLCFIDYINSINTVRVQHIDSFGNLLWGAEAMPISIRDSYLTSGGGIVADGADGFIALYNEKDTEEEPSKLRAQRFDAQANRLWGDEGIVVKESSGFTDMESDGDGGMVTLAGQHLYRLSSSGDSLWGEQGVTAPNGASSMVISNSEFVYTTMGESLNNGTFILKIQKLSLLDGSLQWDSLGVTVDTIDVDSEVYDFVIDDADNLWITWYRVWGEPLLQKITDSGTPVFPAPGVPVSLFESNKSVVSLQTSADSDILAIWTDNRPGASGVYGQRISSVGDYLWSSDTHLSTLVSSGGLKPVSDNAGGAIVSWFHLGTFGIYVQQISRNGNLGEVLTSIHPSEADQLPVTLILFPNYPNPFNSTTVIGYQLPVAGEVRVTVYDLLGRLTRDLVNGLVNAGYHQVKWDGTNTAGEQVASGIYLYQLETESETQIRKLLLIK